MNDAVRSIDPSERLTAAFRAAADRMAGLAFVNPALAVEAVDFAPWQGRWLGVLVTPWCMNLVLTRLEPAAWRSLAPGAKRTYRFPAGDYDFVGAADEAAGEVQACSLFSPLLQFDDQPSARLVAALARAALFDPAHAGPPEPEAIARSRVGPLHALDAALEAPVSRRDLFHGRLRR